MLNRSKKRNVFLLSLVLLLLIFSVSFFYLKKHPPLVHSSSGLHLNGSSFALLENEGSYNIKITNVLINGTTKEVNLCRSHINGVPDLDQFECQSAIGSSIEPALTDKELEEYYSDPKNNIDPEKQKYYDFTYDQKPFYSLWHSEKDVHSITIYYQYLGINHEWTREFDADSEK